MALGEEFIYDGARWRKLTRDSAATCTAAPQVFYFNPLTMVKPLGQS